MGFFSSICKTALAAMTVFAVVFLFAWMFFDVGGKGGFSMLAVFFVIWIVMAAKVDKSEMDGGVFHHLVHLLNKSHQLSLADGIIILVTVAGFKIFLGVVVLAQIWPLLVAFLFGIGANDFNKDAKNPWPIDGGEKDKKKENEDSEGQDSDSESGTDSDSDAGKDFGDANKTIVYDWLMDPSRGIKLSGHLELKFSGKYVEWLRKENPYSGIVGTNEKAISYMLQRMKQNHRLLHNVRTIANYVNRECSKKLLFEYDRLQFVLDFVQEPNIKYIHDDKCEELNNCPQYVRYPDETLFDKRGDCDCKTMLAAMIFWVMGYNVIFLLSSKLHHAALGLEYDSHWNKVLPREEINDIVHEFAGRRYIFCETTGDGFRIGSITQGQKIEDFESFVIFEQE